MPQKEVQARQVLLSWEPGSDGLSPVRYYTVQQRELPESNWSVHSASVSHGATSYIVSRWRQSSGSSLRCSSSPPHPPSASSPDRLKPFTSYQFRVKATNDIGDSEYSQESEAITTLQDGERLSCAAARACRSWLAVQTRCTTLAVAKSFEEKLFSSRRLLFCRIAAAICFSRRSLCALNAAARGCI